MGSLHEIALKRGLFIGYKVVRAYPVGTVMCSLAGQVLYNIELGRTLFYKFGQWTRHKFKCGSMAVFRDYADAVNFRRSFDWDKGNSKILVCLCTPGKIRGLGVGVSYQRNWLMDSSVPMGTEYADCVYPVREVT